MLKKVFYSFVILFISLAFNNQALFAETTSNVDNFICAQASKLDEVKNVTSNRVVLNQNDFGDGAKVINSNLQGSTSPWSVYSQFKGEFKAGDSLRVQFKNSSDLCNFSKVVHWLDTARDENMMSPTVGNSWVVNGKYVENTKYMSQNNHLDDNEKLWTGGTYNSYLSSLPKEDKDFIENYRKTHSTGFHQFMVPQGQIRIEATGSNEIKITNVAKVTGVDNQKYLYPLTAQMLSLTDENGGNKSFYGALSIFNNVGDAENQAYHGHSDYFQEKLAGVLYPYNYALFAQKFPQTAKTVDANVAAIVAKQAENNVNNLVCSQASKLDEIKNVNNNRVILNQGDLGAGAKIINSELKGVSDSGSIFDQFKGEFKAGDSLRVQFKNKEDLCNLTKTLHWIDTARVENESGTSFANRWVVNNGHIENTPYMSQNNHLKANDALWGPGHYQGYLNSLSKEDRDYIQNYRSSYSTQFFQFIVPQGQIQIDVTAANELKITNVAKLENGKYLFPLTAQMLSVSNSDGSNKNYYGALSVFNSVGDAENQAYHNHDDYFKENLVSVLYPYNYALFAQKFPQTAKTVDANSRATLLKIATEHVSDLDKTLALVAKSGADAEALAKQVALSSKQVSTSSLFEARANAIRLAELAASENYAKQQIIDQDKTLAASALANQKAEVAAKLEFAKQQIIDQDKTLASVAQSNLKAENLAKQIATNASRVASSSVLQAHADAIKLAESIAQGEWAKTKIVSDIKSVVTNNVNTTNHDNKVSHKVNSGVKKVNSVNVNHINRHVANKVNVSNNVNERKNAAITSDKLVTSLPTSNKQVLPSVNVANVKNTKEVKNGVIKTLHKVNANVKHNKNVNKNSKLNISTANVKKEHKRNRVVDEDHPTKLELLGILIISLFFAGLLTTNKKVRKRLHSWFFTLSA